MKILFIRHGETTDNLRHVYAGITDSSLTSHGVLQTARLATHLATSIPPVTHIFASPLSRAKKTAEAIHDEQKRARSKPKSTDTTASDAAAPDVPETENTSTSGSVNSDKEINTSKDEKEGEEIYFAIDPDLIEQDFGSYEGETFLTVTPKKNLKKRKRSDSIDNGGAGTISNPNTPGDSKKRRADNVETASGPSTIATPASTATVDATATTTNDVEMKTTAATQVDSKPPEIEEEDEEEFREMETPASIKARADSFIRRCIIPLLPGQPTLLPPPLARRKEDEAHPPPPQLESNANPVIAIVSHGMLLSWLWKSFVSLFPPSSVLATTPVVEKGWYQGKHPGWGNTGYLVVEVLPKGVVAKDGMTVVIEGVNEKIHLIGLRRTGGGVGSEKFDERQTKLDGFFKK
ncbi:hypothetical protein TWF694_002078 [Orbilia ellipsospora]|uniref:Phosphoglycerate mutase-like protein n=1 Tax=Orbilia ellipsospora TaxID=2528407 RepID=A0AAV9X5P2_9PEZI